MSHHIATGEFGHGDAFDVLKDFDCMRQSAFMAFRQINLRGVARDDGFAAKPDACQKHFHLFGGRVLRFIQNDKRMVQRTTSHVG